MAEGAVVFNAQGVKKSRKTKKSVPEGSTEEVLLAEVQRLLSTLELDQSLRDDNRSQEASLPAATAPERFSEVMVSIESLSSTGDGLGFTKDRSHVYVVPFTVPGDSVTAKIVTQNTQARYTITDLLSVITPSSRRDDGRVKCQYFGRCSGCQFQMLAYSEQLEHKRTIIERAYRHFSNLIPEQIPRIGDTIPSPLEYGYRTKLTPHFDGPPGSNRRRKAKGSEAPKFTTVPPIGFNYKNRRKVLDVEDCPIATDAVRSGLVAERARVRDSLQGYRRGATILLRETIKKQARAAKDEEQNDDTVEGSDATAKEGQKRPHEETKTYTTDNNSIAVESVEDYVFHNVAGAFFQNNNSILPDVAQYIRDRIIHPTGSQNRPNDDSASPTIVNLLDAYCGSGLFTIMLSSIFQRSIGIDISDASIECARKNAELNGVKNTRFISATASMIFANLDIEPDATAVVIDPPRKGCDKDFIDQLLRFGPQRIVYVSCNVHTQARDVGLLVEGHRKSPERSFWYEIESLCGFDFFPQTSHVEGVAILSRRNTR